MNSLFNVTLRFSSYSNKIFFKHTHYKLHLDRDAEKVYREKKSISKKAFGAIQAPSDADLLSNWTSKTAAKKRSIRYKYCTQRRRYTARRWRKEKKNKPTFYFSLKGASAHCNRDAPAHKTNKTGMRKRRQKGTDVSTKNGVKERNRIGGVPASRLMPN